MDTNNYENKLYNRLCKTAIEHLAADIKKLEDTIPMMNSNDYKERFKAEYYQLKIRLDKLNEMLENWDKGELKFTPTCQRELYTRQVKAMNDYLKVLETRAYIEVVDI